MAFSLRDLSVLAYANGFTLWHYRGRANSVAEVQQAGFLDEAHDMLAAGDMVMVSAADGAKLLCIAPGRQPIRAVPVG
jgi:hypothetical protein